MPRRWPMPIENWPARCLATLRQPDDVEHLVDPAAADAVALGDAEQMVVARSGPRGSRRPRASRRPRTAGGAARRRAAADRSRSLVGASRPMTMRSVVDLPGAVGSEEAGDPAGQHLEGEVVDGERRSVPLRESVLLRSSLVPIRCWRRSYAVMKTSNCFLVFCYYLAMSDWSFLTNHARAILSSPGHPTRVCATSPHALEVTERTAFGIVADLTEAGYVVKEKDGRRNRYKIQVHLPLRDTVGRSARSARCWICSARRNEERSAARSVPRHDETCYEGQAFTQVRGGASVLGRGAG